MSMERIIGIDFGTSTSVIRVRRYENGRPAGDVKEVKFGNNSLVPTLIQRVQDGEPYYGYDAQKKHKNAVLFENFKVDLESADAEKKAQARALTEEFFTYLAKAYKEQSAFFGEAGDTEKTIVSYPVKWSDETRSFMLEAARKAGFPNVEGMDEAQAAVGAVMVHSADYLAEKGYLYDGQPVNILMADMGAGTTDLVLCRYTPGTNSKYEVLSAWPRDGRTFFGGRELEELLREYLRGKLPAEDAERVMKRCGLDKFKSWKEDYVSPALKRGETVTEFYDFDNITEMLDIDMEEYALNRAELETLAVNYLRGFPRLVNGCLKDAGISGSEVDLALLTGGHSQWYFVAEQLSGNLSQCGEIGLDKIQKDPERIIPVPRPQETVALGLVYSPLVGQIRFAAEEPKREPTVKESEEKREPISEEKVEIKPEVKTELLVTPEEELVVWSESERELPVTPEEEFEFREVEGGYEVAAYLGDREVVSIPSQYRGKAVVAIGQKAFDNNGKPPSGLKEVEIPGSCYRIKSRAFGYISTLEKVILHRGLTNIGSWAFGFNKKLSFVEFPEGLLEIGDNAFWNCNLSRIRIPASCCIIGRAFSCNHGLSEVIFPADSQIKIIDEQAFVYTNIHRIKLPVSCKCNRLIQKYEKKLVDVGCGDFFGIFNKPTPPEFITIERY